MRRVRVTASAAVAVLALAGAAMAAEDKAAKHQETPDDPPVPASVLLVIGGAIGLYSASRARPRKR